MASSPKSQECNWLFFIVLSAIRGGDSRCTDRFRNLKWESVESLVIAMKNYLDFEKPIAELQRKMDELQRHREAHGIEISLDKEIRQIKEDFRGAQADFFRSDSVAAGAVGPAPQTPLHSGLHPDRVFGLC
jgi:hypothetical protein